MNNNQTEQLINQDKTTNQYKQDKELTWTGQRTNQQETADVRHMSVIRHVCIITTSCLTLFIQ